MSRDTENVIKYDSDQIFRLDISCSTASNNQPFSRQTVGVRRIKCSAKRKELADKVDFLICVTGCSQTTRSADIEMIMCTRNHHHLTENKRGGV